MFLLRLHERANGIRVKFFSRNDIIILLVLYVDFSERYCPVSVMTNREKTQTSASRYFFSGRCVNIVEDAVFDYKQTVLIKFRFLNPN